MPSHCENENSNHFSKFVGFANPWVAITFARNYFLISAHLSHRRLSTLEFTGILEELSVLITKHPKRKVILGMDANARVVGLHDSRFIGPTVPPAELIARERGRGGLLLEFLAKHDFYLANTWAKESIVELMVTRVAWDQMCAAQVDFIAASSSLRCALRIPLSMDRVLHR